MMVSLKMVHASVLSNAEHHDGFTSMQKRGRRVSASQERKEAIYLIKWALYNHLHTSNYTRVHHDTVSNVIDMRVNSSPNIVQVTQKHYNMDMLDLLKVSSRQLGTSTMLT
jgi:hypothetical protein